MMSTVEWLECQLDDMRRWYWRTQPAHWMAHLWDNLALWVALYRVKAWQDLHASKQRNCNR